MKKQLFIISSAFLVSCTGNSETAEKKISELQKTNDSLRTVLDTLKTKFIFDHAFVRHNPINIENLKPGEKYTGEFFFVAYNEDDGILFSPELNSSTFDTLRVDKEERTYVYNAIAKRGTNNYVFKPLIKSKTDFRNSMFGGGITISDKKIIP